MKKEQQDQRMPIGGNVSYQPSSAENVFHDSNSLSPPKQQRPLDFLTMNNIDWNDRAALQNDILTNEEKGWHVSVQWKATPHGVGLFAMQDIPAGTTMRIGMIGGNVLPFRSQEDLESFCALARDPREYRSRVKYLADYVACFNYEGTDDNGYLLPSQVEKHKASDEGRLFCLWFPGNGTNHSTEPNFICRMLQHDSIEHGICIQAFRTIKRGDEIVGDYRRLGKAPSWLLEFSKRHRIPLAFPGCNDYVKF